MRHFEKLRLFLSDSVWSIAGLVLMNVTAQFVVYPFWNNWLGSELYGNILYLISLMNIFSISAGCACNNSRMAKSSSRGTINGDYGFSLLIFSFLAIPFGVAAYWLSFRELVATDIFLYVALIVLTMWRFYSDVQYRLNMDYRGYFRYYLFISLGYLLGVGVFWVTGRWPLALISGELAGLGVTYFYKSNIRSGLFQRSKSWKYEFRSILTLMGSSVIGHAVFNGDRLLLNILLGGSAVTTYYLASLLGKTMSLISTPMNSVLIGYLSRYKGTLSIRLMHYVTGALMVISLVISLGCAVISPILISFLYPENLGSVAAYFFVANLTQVVYFAGNMMNMVLLRFGAPKCQLVVNSVYAISFVLLCIPSVRFGGFDGFCNALLIANIVRLAVGVVLGYFESLKGNEKNDH